MYLYLSMLKDDGSMPTTKYTTTTLPFVKTWIIAVNIPHYVFVAACFLAAMTSCKNCCCVLVVGSGRPID